MHTFSCSGKQACVLKGKAIPVQAYYKPRGFQEVEAPKFRDNRHMKMVRSALRIGRLYPPPQGVFLVLISVTDWAHIRRLHKSCLIRLEVKFVFLSEHTLQYTHTHSHTYSWDYNWDGTYVRKICLCDKLAIWRPKFIYVVYKTIRF
jgi:hypothetical protein